MYTGTLHNRNFYAPTVPHFTEQMPIAHPKNFRGRPQP